MDCSAEATEDENLHTHHLVSRSLNGPDTLDNLITLCLACHKKRHATNGIQKRYKSVSYSLSDEVVAAIDEARSRGLTPNQFLRRVLGIGGIEGVEVRINGKLLDSSQYSVSDNGVVTLDDRPLLDAVGPELSSGRGKATTETYRRGHGSNTPRPPRVIRRKGDAKR